MEQPIRRVPRITPEMKLKMKFESSTNKIEELLDAGDIWAAKRVAKVLVLEINRSCNNRELQSQYYSTIRELCGYYFCIGDFLDEHRYKSEARRAREAQARALRWK